MNESQLPNERPDAYVLRLAQAKARAALAVGTSAQVILASDTTVVDGELILGKPSGPEEAAVMLRSLRGRQHQVLTALAVLRVADELLLTDLCRTQVPMRDYTEAELQAYVSSGDPLDKAGAYAIQHAGFHPVAHLEGCFASVMGLPLCHVVRTLSKLGFSLPPGVDVPTACQIHLDYSCPIYEAVLKGEEIG